MATDIEDTVHAVDAAALLRLLPARPRVLALGEPTHGEDTLLETRNALFRQLVEDEGYRTIAIESDALLALVVDDHVTSGAGTLDDVMEHGFSHGFGSSAANRDLVRWMRAHNDGRPVEDQVRFAGLDAPLEITGPASPRHALLALHGCLAAEVDAESLPCTAATLDRLLGPDDRWTDEGAMRDPSRSVGRSPEAGELRLLADDMTSLVHERSPRLIARTSREAWDRARLYGRTASGLLRYHSWLADTSPGRMTRLLGVRDQLMADNLLALAERGPTLAFAHHLHLQRHPGEMRMGGQPFRWWSAGALAAARLGREYAVVTTGLGTIRHRGVDTPPKDTVEGLLYGLPQDRVLLDTRRPATALTDPPPTPRVSSWFGYFPLTPEHLTGSDAILYIRDVPRV